MPNDERSRHRRRTMRRRRRRPSSSSTAASLAAEVEVETSSHVELRHTEYSPPETDTDRSSREPVLILHGLLGSKRNFVSLATSLSAQLRRPRRVLTLDLRNHGDNGHDWRPDMSYPSMARDVLSAMDRMGIDRAVLVGHSMGGKVAAAAALLDPDRISGLVVLDIAPVRYEPGRDEAWGAVTATIEALSGVELVRETKGEAKSKREVDRELRVGPLEDPALRAFVMTNLEQRRRKDKEKERGGGELSWKINVEAIRDQLDVIAGFDLLRNDDDGANGATADSDSSSSLRYEGDAFFITGGSSRFVSQNHLPVIGTYFPNYMVTSIRGAGHWIHAEAPDDTLALVKRYLDR